jgi:hypothetical protein
MAVDPGPDCVPSFAPHWLLRSRPVLLPMGWCALHVYIISVIVASGYSSHRCACVVHTFHPHWLQTVVTDM